MLTLNEILPAIGVITNAGQRAADRMRAEEMLTAYKLQQNSLAEIVEAMTNGRLNPRDPAQIYPTFLLMSVVEFHAEFRCGENVAAVSALRTFLWQMCSDLTLPKLIRTKAMVCISALAKAAWPALMPSFMDDLLGMAASSPVALQVLRICGEELCSGRESHALGARRTELKVLMDQVAVKLFAVASQIVLSGTTDVGLKKSAFSCVKQYITWAPLEHILCAKPSFLDAVFASLRNPALMCTAVSTMTSLISRQFVCPPNLLASVRFVEIFDQGLNLIDATAKTPASVLEQTLGVSMDKYFSKLFLLLQAIMGNLRRVKNWSNLASLIQVYFTFTKIQPNTSSQLKCLECFSTVMEDILYRISDEEDLPPNAEKPMTALKLGSKPIFFQAISQCMQLCMFASNHDVLTEMDDSSPSENEEDSELAAYVNECLNILVAISELYPEETLREICNAVVGATEKFCANVTAATADQLADLGTYQNLASRFVELLVDDHLSPRFESAQKMFQAAIQSIFTLNNLSQAMGSASVSNDFPVSKPHSRIIASLPMWYRWLVDLIHSENYKEIGNDYIVKVIDVLLPILTKNVCASPAVVSAAAHAFRILCEQVRSPSLNTHPTIVQMLSIQGGANTICASTPMTAQTNLLSALVAIFALPTVGLSMANQNWEERTKRCQNFLAPLVANFCGMPQAIAQNGGNVTAAMMDNIKVLVDLLRAIVSVVTGQGTNGKKVVFAAIGPCLTNSVALSVALSRFPGVFAHVLSFVNSFFTCFGVSFIGPKVVNETVSAIMSLISAGGSAQDVVFSVLRSAAPYNEVTAAAVSCICSVFDLLKSLVKERNAFTPLLQSSLSLALDTVFATLNTPELRLAHITVFRSVVKFVIALLNWYWDNVAASAFYPKVLDMLVCCLSDDDPAVFSDVVCSLEKLNSSSRIFHKSEFQQHAWMPVAKALATSVVLQKHALRRDEAILALHLLGGVAWGVFFDQFLPAFIDTLPSITPEQKMALLRSFLREKDLPTFSRCMTTMMNDYTYYVRSNAATTSSGKT